jgi:hypothetical protein
LALILFWLGSRTRAKTKPPYAYLYHLSRRKLIKSEITTPIFRVGRHPNNELRLNDRSISRFHAEIVRNQNGSFSIYDMRSKNGIRVGLRPVNSSLLKEGDIIDIGRIRFRFTKFPRDYNMFRHTDMIEPIPTQYDRRRRRFERQDVAFNVRLYHDASGWLNGRIRDLSQQGAFIEVERHITPRAPVDVVFPIFSGTQQRWLRLPGEVVRENNEGVGISFGELDDSASKALRTIAKAA